VSGNRPQVCQLNLRNADQERAFVGPFLTKFNGARFHC
jgi:hypothetical protein